MTGAKSGSATIAQIKQAAPPEEPQPPAGSDGPVAQRVRGLRLGADDWLTKPCHPEELIARIESVIRRRRRFNAPTQARVQVGEVQIRADQFQAFVRDQSVDVGGHQEARDVVTAVAGAGHQDEVLRLRRAGDEVLAAMDDPAVVAQWLFEHAKEMTEAMFFDPNNEWMRFAPEHLLVMRACAPADVFTVTAKAGYLARVGGNPTLTEITEALFAGDYDFLQKLPETLEPAIPELATLMQIAYKRRIRPADARVKAL
mgnify:CR=1 FL=1